MRHQRFLFSLAQAFFHRFFNTCQAHAVLVFGQFTDTANTAIAQVVNVIDLTMTIAQINQNLDHSQNVFIGQYHWPSGLGTAHFGVELHPPDTRQIVGIGVVEQALEQRLHSIFSRWLARAHHAVDGHPCSKLVDCFVGAQGLRNISPLIEFIGVNAGYFLDP
ncbi:hypothetical protein GALL_503350 [mine drainage metagenome]|uniref:Uncharacterized protein n=1 Tax=mine drainage metagenome TaxID=410659 RepID=A0A1J5PKI0_9ZZZZ